MNKFLTKTQCLNLKCASKDINRNQFITLLEFFADAQRVSFLEIHSFKIQFQKFHIGILAFIERIFPILRLYETVSVEGDLSIKKT